MINPNRLDQRLLFENEFMGMTDYVVQYEALEEAREMLIHGIDAALTDQDRDFLISFKEVNPLWDLLGINHIKDMPAIKWKLHNIGKMEPKKHQTALNELKRKLSF